MTDWLTPLLNLEREHGLLLFVRGRDDIELGFGRPLTDAEWERVRATAAWRKGGEDDAINDLICQIVDEAVAEARIEPLDSPQEG